MNDVIPSIEMISIEEFDKRFDPILNPEGSYLVRTISNGPMKYETYLQVRMKIDFSKFFFSKSKPCFSFDCSNQTITHVSSCPIV